jgi:MinD superfamily P-loop ATPase
VPAGVLINKHDLCPELTSRIEALANEANAAVVGRLPFSPAVPRALARGELPLAVEALSGPLVEAWKETFALLSSGDTSRLVPQTRSADQLRMI